VLLHAFAPTMVDKKQLLAEKDITKRAQKIAELTTKLKIPDLITAKGITQVSNLSPLYSLALFSFLC
jgi:hypothetical protein